MKRTTSLLPLVIFLMFFNIESNSALIIKFNKSNISQEILENVHFEIIYSMGGSSEEIKTILPFGEHNLSNSNNIIVKSIDAVYGYNIYT